MPLDLENIPALAKECAERTPQEILELALHSYDRGHIAISFSGAEDVVLIDMAIRIDPHVRVFTLDTGRLHTETYEFLERVREHYRIPIEIYFPQVEAVQQFVAQKGLFSFYRDGHKECCDIRKVEPLKRALRTVDAWVTGQRQDQSPGTRAQVPVIQVDPTFRSEQGTLIKFNPLAQWTSCQVFDYIRTHRVPVNELHRSLVNVGGDYRALAVPAYVSIGCQPCTTVLLPGEHERAARWRWEESTKKECGLHAGNIPQA